MSLLVWIPILLWPEGAAALCQVKYGSMSAAVPVRVDSKPYVLLEESDPRKTLAEPNCQAQSPTAHHVPSDDMLHQFC